MVPVLVIDDGFLSVVSAQENDVILSAGYFYHFIYRAADCMIANKSDVL